MGILIDFVDKSTNGGFCEYNPKFSEVLITDNIIKLEFKKLYSNLVVQFCEEGLLGYITIESVINELGISFSYLKELVKKDIFSPEDNIILNSLYGKLDFHTSVRISGYIYSIMEYYFNEFRGSIIYIDTDIIFMTEFVGEDFIKSIGIPYSLNCVNQFYLHSKKRYLLEEGGSIITKGVSNLYWSNKNIIRDMELQMVSNKRSRKLKELGF